MADYFAGQIEIGGPLHSRTLNALIGAIINYGRLSLVGYGDVPASDVTLREAFQTGPTVKLYDDQARYGQFDELEEFLVRRHIHFDRLRDARYEYNAELVRYRGRGKPAVFPSNTDGQMLVKVEEVLRILGNRRLTADRKLQAVWLLVAPPEAAPLAPIKLVTKDKKKGGA
jgi:hypothetical protein